MSISETPSSSHAVESSAHVPSSGFKCEKKKKVTNKEKKELIL